MVKAVRVTAISASLFSLLSTQVCPPDKYSSTSELSSSSDDLMFRPCLSEHIVHKLDCSGPDLEHNRNKFPRLLEFALLPNCYPTERIAVFLPGRGVSAPSCNVVWDKQSWFPQKIPVCWEGDRASFPVPEAPLLCICLQVACKTPLEIKFSETLNFARNLSLRVIKSQWNLRDF